MGCLPRALALLAGVGGGVIAPASAAFTSFPPPLFSPISLLVPAVGAALLYVARSVTFKRFTDGLLAAVVSIAIGLSFLAGYWLFRQHTTVVNPQNAEQRLQIGFGMNDWSLTELGRRYKADYPAWRPLDLLLAEGRFDQDGAELLWVWWSIYLAGFILFMFYLFSFGLWAWGFGLIARHKAEERSRRNV